MLLKTIQSSKTCPQCGIKCKISSKKCNIVKIILMETGRKLDIKMIVVIGWVLRYGSFFILPLAYFHIFIFSFKRYKLLLLSGTRNIHMITTTIKHFSSAAQGGKKWKLHKTKSVLRRSGFSKECYWRRCQSEFGGSLGVCN